MELHATARRGNVRGMKRLVILALVACGGSSPKPAPAPAPPPIADTPKPVAAPTNAADAPLPLWPAVKKGQLSNGLTYYVLKHGKPEKRAFLWLAVNAGSVQEDDDQRGLAHFDEHMAFNGTKRFPKNALIKYLESIGMRFGADLNAYTTWDQTVYQLEVPTDKADFIGKGLDILRDWAGDVTYDPEEVAKERGVVKEEWRLGRGANMRLFDKQAKVLFKGSRYANRITIGLPEIIDKAPQQALVRYYRDWYRPDLMAVIAVGDFEPAEIEKEIKARFGDLQTPKTPRARPSGGMPPAEGTRVSIETDREAMSTTLTIQNLVRHRPESSKADYRRTIAEQVYSMILNERLALLRRKPDAPFIGASVGVSGVVRDVDSFTRFANVKVGHVEDALRALLTEVVRLEKHGVTATELERARTNVQRSFEQLADTEATRDSRQFTDEITRNFFQQELMIGSKAERDLALAALPTLTIAELNQLGKSFGGAEGRVILISGPEGKPLPSQQRVLEIVAEVEKANVTPWEDAAPKQALMEHAPKAGKVTKEKTVDKIGVTEWTLSNGIRVVVKPTDYELDNVMISGSSPGGQATAKNKDYSTIRWADQVVDVSGIDKFDTDTLAKMLVGRQVRFSTSIGETTESISANGSVKDLETMFQLLYLRATAPRKDVEAFNVWRSNMTEQITNALRSPEFKYARESNIALWKGNVRRKPAEPDEIAKVDEDKALAFYKDRFADFSDFTFVIVGSIKLETLKPLVETYLASLPGKGRKEKEKDLNIRRVPGVVKKVFKLGSEPKAAVQIEFHGPQKWTRDNDRDMYVLGEVLEVKLRNTMREDMGGVYGVGASGRISRSPYQERSFGIRFGCDPARVDELVKAALDGAAALAKDGADEETLANVKEQFVKGRETELRTNRFWLGWLATSYKYGDDPTIVLDTAPMIARMKPALVKAAAKRYLDPKQYYESVRLPEK